MTIPLAVARGGIRRPMLFRGVAAQWAPISCWSPNYLKETVGHRAIGVELYSEDFQAGPRRLITMPLRTYLDQYTHSGERMYAADLELADLPELIADLEDLPIFEAETGRWKLYIGYDSVTPLHYHEVSHAALVQVRGRKRVLLAAPTSLSPEQPWFSSRRNFSERPLDSWIRRERPDAGIIGQEVVLVPGDILVIPIHWWHAVHGPGSTISLTYFWPAPSADRISRRAIRAWAGSIAELGFVGVAYAAYKTGQLSSLCKLARRMHVVESSDLLEEQLSAAFSRKRRDRDEAG